MQSDDDEIEDDLKHIDKNFRNLFNKTKSIISILNTVKLKLHIRGISIGNFKRALNLTWKLVLFVLSLSIILFCYYMFVFVSFFI